MRRFLPLILVGLIASGVVAWAAAPGVINAYNALCSSAFPTRCVLVNSDGSVPTTPASGVTADVNLKQVNGATTSAFNTGAVGAQTQRVTLATDVNLPVGTGTAGTAAANVVTVQGVASMTPIQVSSVPATSGGLSWYFVQPAASDNHVVIKAGAGQVYNVHATNNSATVNYLRLYNATTGFNGCNSATNIVGQWAIPASTSVGGIALSMPTGIAFATGISICVTSGYATTDTTNATASAMSVNVGYK